MFVQEKRAHNGCFVVLEIPAMFTYELAIMFPKPPPTVCKCVCTHIWRCWYLSQNVHGNDIPDHQIPHKAYQISLWRVRREATLTLGVTVGSPTLYLLLAVTVTTVTHRFSWKGRDAYFLTCSIFLNATDSSESGKSVNEPLALNLPRGGVSPWRTPTQRVTGAQEARWALQA